MLGCSKAGTRRYGRVLTWSQVRTHVAVAILTVLHVVAVGSGFAALAGPDNRHHRELLGPLVGLLHDVRVAVICGWAPQRSTYNRRSPCRSVRLALFTWTGRLAGTSTASTHSRARVR